MHCLSVGLGSLGLGVSLADCRLERDDSYHKGKQATAKKYV